jgi:hypothetical protein
MQLTWWGPIILVFQRLWQKDLKFQDSWSYTHSGILSPKQKRKRNKEKEWKNALKAFL